MNLLYGLLQGRGRVQYTMKSLNSSHRNVERNARSSWYSGPRQSEQDGSALLATLGHCGGVHPMVWGDGNQILCLQIAEPSKVKP